jgi:hypothetical protein
MSLGSVLHKNLISSTFLLGAFQEVAHKIFSLHKTQVMHTNANNDMMRTEAVG